jgi:carbonic anhydrase/acetyltransferase-like protein (isoleucine patch superfamily)
MIEAFDGVHPVIAETAFVHARATVIGDVVLGEYASVWPGAVLRGDFGPIRVGARTNVQDNVVVHSSDPGTFIGRSCIVGHQAFIEQAVIEDCCLVGVGAKVLHGAAMRTGSVAAAGAVLVEKLEVPSGCRAQGVPARVVAIGRPSRDEIGAGAEEYVEMARRFREGG